MFHSYPYTDFHELNLDGLLKEFKKVTTDVSRLQSIVENLDINEDDALNIRGESLYAPFAQALPTNARVFNSGLGGQGMAIGNFNGAPVLLQCFSDGTVNGTGNIMAFYNMETGTVIGRYNVPSGHCNSACYCPDNDSYFIACGGGNSLDDRIVEIDINGNIKSQTTIDGGAWAITYNNGKLYFLSGSTLNVANRFVDIAESYPITTADGLTYQGMFSDDNYLYLPCGNTVYYSDETNVNYYEVRNHEGAVLGYIKNAIPFECEEGDFLDGTLYVSCPYQDMAAIFISDLYNDKFQGYLSSEVIMSDVFNSQNLYIDETYNGFFMDGTEDKPYSTLLRYTAFVRSNVSRLTIHLLSDCPTHIFAMQKNTPYQVVLNGHDHSVLRVNWQGSIFLSLMNLVILGSDNATSCLIDVTRCYLDHITFGEANSSITPNRLLEIHGAFEITNITFNQSPSSTNGVGLYIMGNGYMRSITVNVDSWRGNLMGGVIDVDNTYPFQLFNVDLYGTTYQLQFYLNTSGLDVTTLKTPLSIDVANGNITFVNAPTGYESGISAIKVDSFASGNRKKALVTMIKTDGTMTQFFNS